MEHVRVQVGPPRPANGAQFGVHPHGQEVGAFEQRLEHPVEADEPGQIDLSRHTVIEA